MRIVRYLFPALDGFMSGNLKIRLAVYIIKYRQGKYEYEQILPLNEKSFKLDAGESFTYKLDISDYMKEQLITIEGILLGGLKPYSDSRHILMRRKIDAAKDTAACNVSAHPQ